MPNNDIENKAIETYSKNLKFLEKNHKELFDKIKLFEMALGTNEIKENYDLEYKEDYFDVLDLSSNEYIYNENSLKYSENIIENVDFKTKKNTFKTFYGFKYEDKVASASKKASIYSNSVFGNAPILSYINDILPTDESMKKIYIYTIFGVGLGLHLPLLDEKIDARLYLIIEPSLELFRLSLFVTEYYSFSNSKILLFSVAEEKDTFSSKFKKLYNLYMRYNYYMKFFKFSQNCESYITAIQNTLVTQNHLLYSYERSLLSLKRTYQYVNDGFSYINISKNNNFKSLANKPILFLAAGPSFSKEIDFVKANKERFVIVAVYRLVPHLEEHGIIPDIVAQYDESNKGVMDYIDKVKNKKYFDKTIFLFSSHIYIDLMHSFPKENIYIFNALFKSKKDSSALVAPSIGEITYLLLHKLGANTIYLLGLDMALDKDGKTHQSNESGAVDGTYKGNFHLRKSVIPIKGNFESTVNTLALFQMSITHINAFTQMYKAIRDTKIFNLSHGAYFEDVIPLNCKDIKISDLALIKKDLFHIEFKESLGTIASCVFEEEDVEYNKEKYEAAEKLKSIIESFFVGKKYGTIEKFQAILDKFNKEIRKEMFCDDLRSILLNYCDHNLPAIYYFMNVKNIANPKKHIKYLQKTFHFQLSKIIEEYLTIIKMK